MADASKMHELLPQNAHYMAIARVSEHSCDYDPPMETATGAHVRKNKPGVIPSRPGFTPKAKYMHNAAHGGYQHVRPLDEMLAERDERRARAAAANPRRKFDGDSAAADKDAEAIQARLAAQQKLSVAEQKGVERAEVITPSEQ